MYELRGLASTSVLFGAWGVLGTTLLRHGALPRFRRALMKPLLVHLDGALRACNSDAVHNMVRGGGSLEHLLRACLLAALVCTACGGLHIPHTACACVLGGVGAWLCCASSRAPCDASAAAR